MPDDPKMDDLLSGRDKRSKDAAAWDEFTRAFDGKGPARPEPPKPAKKAAPKREPSMEDLLAGRDRKAEDDAAWGQFVGSFDSGGAERGVRTSGKDPGPQGNTKPEPAPIVFDRKVDLHGSSRREAADLLARRVREGRMQGHRVLLVVTGRGLHSEGGPVLADWLAGWAAAHAPGAPLRCEVAPKEEGGPGAWFLFVAPRSG